MLRLYMLIILIIVKTSHIVDIIYHLLSLAKINYLFLFNIQWSLCHTHSHLSLQFQYQLICFIVHLNIHIHTRLYMLHIYIHLLYLLAEFRHDSMRLYGIRSTLFQLLIHLVNHIRA